MKKSTTITTEADKKSRAERYKNNILSCFNDIESQIYFAERLLQGFKEQYFGTSEEAFQSSETAKADFIYDHEYMAAQIQALSDMLFDIRLKSEFVGGDKENPIVAAHIRNEDEMRSWLHDSEKEVHT